MNDLLGAVTRGFWPHQLRETGVDPSTSFRSHIGPVLAGFYFVYCSYEVFTGAEGALV